MISQSLPTLIFLLSIMTISSFRLNRIKKPLSKLMSTITTGTSTNELATVSNIILFDGVCNFCNSWVNLLLDIDTKKKFKYCALQSSKGKELLKQIGKAEDDISSVVYIKSLQPVQAYFRSEAALKVAEELGSGFGVLSVIGRGLVPLPFLRDSLYDMVATNRYKLMGKRDTCRCEDEDMKDRFIS